MRMSDASTLNVEVVNDERRSLTMLIREASRVKRHARRCQDGQAGRQLAGSRIGGLCLPTDPNTAETLAGNGRWTDPFHAGR